MKTSRFGIEIEFYNLQKKDAAKVLAKVFNSKVSSNSSYKFKVKDSKNRIWTITTDRSLHNAVDEPKPYKQQYCGEFITPIITHDDLPMLFKAVEALKDAGAKSDGEHGCSVHVHIDETGLSTKDICNLCRQHRTIYQDIATSFHLTKTQQTVFTKNLPSKFISSLSDTTTKSQLKELWYKYVDVLKRPEITHYNKSRYSVINLHSMYEGKGIELRYFKFFTLLDTKLLENIINYSLMVTKSRTKIYKTLPAYIDAMNEEDELHIDKDILLKQKVLRVKPAKQEDLDKIYKLYADREEWFNNKKIKQWINYTSNNPKEIFADLIDNDLLYKVCANNEIVGAFELCTKSKYWKDNDKALYVCRVVTKVETRDLGSIIFKYCEDVCRAKHITRLRSYYPAKNKKLGNLLKEYEFKVEKTYKTDLNEFSLIEKNI